MTEKRFELNKDCEWWFVKDNTIKVNEFGYRDDLTGEDAYRGLKQELTEEETVELLNELHEENQQIKDLIHTMLRQIEVENISSDSAIYSARIIFSRNEFNLIRELWKRSWKND